MIYIVSDGNSKITFENLFKALDAFSELRSWGFDVKLSVKYDEAADQPQMAVSSMLSMSGFTPLDIADILGLPFNLVSNWVNGREIPPLRRVLQIAEITGV